MYRENCSQGQQAAKKQERDLPRKLGVSFLWPLSCSTTDALFAIYPIFSPDNTRFKEKNLFQAGNIEKLAHFLYAWPRSSSHAYL